MLIFKRKNKITITHRYTLWGFNKSKIYKKIDNISDAPIVEPLFHDYIFFGRFKYMHIFYKYNDEARTIILPYNECTVFQDYTRIRDFIKEQQHESN